MESSLNEVRIPEIWETEEDKGFSDKNLKTEYFKWALDNIRGKTFTNRSIRRYLLPGIYRKWLHRKRTGVWGYLLG